MTTKVKWAPPTRYEWTPERDARLRMLWFTDMTVRRMSWHFTCGAEALYKRAEEIGLFSRARADNAQDEAP